MSWDIYGNPLQRGHCEVHPHVAEEYPCSICISEKKQYTNESRQQEAEYYTGLRIEALEDALRFCIRALEPYDDIKPRDWKTDRQNLRDAHKKAKQVMGTDQ